MKLKYIIIILCSFSLACSSKRKEIKTVEIKFKKEGNLEIHNQKKKHIASFDIEIADNDFERETGLMYRENIAESQGMLFVFDKEQQLSFYMKNTLIALDILFINGEQEIINIYKNTQPMSTNTIKSLLPAKFVLELKSGSCERLGIEEGLRITYKK